MSSDDEQLENEGSGVADLRKQYEQLQKDLKARDEALAKYQAKDKSDTVAVHLKAKGVDPAAAALYSGDDTSEDAVGKWVESQRQAAVMFGATLPDDPAAAAAAAAATSASRVASATASGHVVSATSDPAPGVILGDPEALMHAIKNQPYEELVKQGIMPSPKAFGNLRR
jgi:hypothetical protein